MSLRSKLFSAMVVLILFMTGVFLIMSHTYMGRVFQQYSTAVRINEAQQQSQLLSWYYQQNQNSWAGVGDYIYHYVLSTQPSGTPSSREVIVVEDENLKPVYASDYSSQIQNEVKTSGTKVPIVISGKVVGTVYVLDTGLSHLYHLQKRILSSMTEATIIGSVLTMIAALLMALWLTRILTNPLNILLRAIREIARGNLRQKLGIQTSDEFGQVSSAFEQMATQLASVEEARRHLVADVAHELRTPLTIMQGQLELIQQGVLKADARTLLPISDECIRLTRLVDDLHQLSLAEAGVLHLERERTDIAALLSRIVDNFQFEAEEKQIRLSFDEPETELVADVDARRITQVFINLIGNAIRYTPQQGQVTVRTTADPSFVRVEVTDTGTGIDDEHLPNLFNRFYRVEQARSREGGGMGLGLAIAKEFVEAHGGSIRVSSHIGTGSTFIVHLPAWGTLSRSVVG